MNPSTTNESKKSRAPRPAIPTSVVSVPRSRGPLASAVKTPSSTALNRTLADLNAWPTSRMRIGVRWRRSKRSHSRFSAVDCGHSPSLSASINPDSGRLGDCGPSLPLCCDERGEFLRRAWVCRGPKPRASSPAYRWTSATWLSRAIDFIDEGRRGTDGRCHAKEARRHIAGDPALDHGRHIRQFRPTCRAGDGKRSERSFPNKRKGRHHIREGQIEPVCPKAP